MNKDKALDLALEVMQINLKLLEKINPYKGQEDLLSDSLDLTHEAITAIKQARSAPVQEHQINQLEKFKNHVLANANALGVVLDAPAAPVQEPSIPEGWERRTVVGFDALVEALDYAERKGFMPDYIADAWEGFNYLAAEKHAQPAQPAPVQEPDHGNELTIAYMSGLHDGKQKRAWVGLTDEEIDQGLCRTPYAMKTAEAWREGVRWAYHQLKEKNT
jgi:hypothetical protein